jgi:DNA anti-recombination protein RmuC
MEKLNQFLKNHGSKVIIALLVLVYFKSCGIDSEVTRIKKDLRATEAEIDTLTNRLDSKIISEERMIELIKTVPAWKTLRIEEISDKERISINALEEKEN